MSLMASRMMTYFTPACAMTSRSKRASALGPVLSCRMRLPPMPSLSTPMSAVFGLASRRRASSSGQRAFWFMRGEGAVGDAVAERDDGAAPGRRL